MIHNAAKVGPDQPRYAEARQITQIALENLDNLMQRKNAADQPKPPVPGKAMGAMMSAFQGLTAGFGDEALGGLAGLGTLLTGGNNQQATNRIQQTQQGFNEQRNAFFGQHPAVAIASDLYGTAANPLNKVLGPLTEGLGPVAKGAVYGVTLGGTRGLGEGTGTLTERLPSAATGAAVGLVAGTALGRAVKIVGPTLGKLVQNARRILGPTAAPAEVASTVEASIRSRLAKLQVAPEDIERAVQSWRQTGELSVERLAETHPPPMPPPTIRPGETLQPTESLDKPTFLRRGATVRQETSPLSLNRTVSLVPGETRAMPDIGRGKTLPYYPRGGKVEQALGQPPPVSSSPLSNLAPQQVAILKQFLQGATPATLKSRLDIIRAIGIPLPPDAESQLLPVLTGHP